MDRKVRAGETIILRAKFFDDIGEEATASGVTIDVLDPDENELVTDGSPTYFAEGIFEYSYTVPHDGPGGIWKDHWEGILNSQVLSADFLFEVSNSGVITDFTNQLRKNNVVDVTVFSGVKGADGSELTENYEFSFLTEISPAYTNIRKLRLEYGGFLGNVDEDILQLGILEASLEADELTWVTTQNPKVFQHARREWTTCRVAANLLTNLNVNALRSKTLGDLSVTYDASGLRDSTERALACMEKWQSQMMTGGYAISSQQPVGVVKGEFDPDRPSVGRLWRDPSCDPSPNDTRLPAANTKDRNVGYRRSKSIFLDPRRKKWF